MADKLSITIALEGGQLIKQQLAEMSDAAQKAFAEIEKAALAVGGFKNLDPSVVTAKLKEMGDVSKESFKKIQDAVANAAKLESIVGAVQKVENGFAAAGEAAVSFGKAVGGIGGALASIAAAAVTSMIKVAEAITTADAAAIKLGVSLQKLTQLQLDFSKVGVGAAALAEGLTKAQAAAEKVGLDKVTKAAKELEEFGKSGFGAQGSSQLALIEKAAGKAGAEGKAAREWLEKMGLPIPSGVAKTLDEMVAKTGSAEAGLRAFKDQLLKLPPSIELNRFALEQLGTAMGTALVQQMAAGGGAAVRLDAALIRLSTSWDAFKLRILQKIEAAGLFEPLINAINFISDRLDGKDWEGWAAFALRAIREVGTGIGWLISTLAGIAWDAIKTAAADAWAAVKQAVIDAKNTVLEFAAALPGIAWDGIKTAAVAAWDAIKEAVGTAKDAVVEFAENLPGDIWDAIKSAGIAAWNAIKQAVADAKTAILEFGNALPGIAWDALKAAGVSALEAIIAKFKEAVQWALKLVGLTGSGSGGSGGTSGSAPGKASGGLIGGRGTGTSDSNLAWVSRGEFIIPARIVRQPGMLALLEALRLSRFAGGGMVGYQDGGPVGGEKGKVLTSLVNNFLDRVRQMIDSIGQAVGQMTISIVDGMRGVYTDIQHILDKIDSVMRSYSDSSAAIIDRTKQASDAVFGFQQSIGSNASGGLIGGIGSGTSDSNLSWVSRGEHIMPAGAVRQPGVLAFLEALRRSGGDLTQVLDGLGRFALGGPVGLPALAAGGMGGGANLGTLTLGLPSGGSVSVRASASVVEQLQREAAMAQVRSGGRKPSRYG